MIINGNMQTFRGLLHQVSSYKHKKVIKIHLKQTHAVMDVNKSLLWCFDNPLRSPSDQICTYSCFKVTLLSNKSLKKEVNH